ETLGRDPALTRAISTPPLRLHAAWHVEHPAVPIGYPRLTSRRIEFCPTTGALSSIDWMIRRMSGIPAASTAVDDRSGALDRISIHPGTLFRREKRKIRQA